MKSHLRPGKVYRREDLAKWSTSVDRELKHLVIAGELVKLAAGLYYRPKQTAFGKAPAEEDSVIHAFLKDGRFLVTSPNAYNALGVGATQLYNETVVYNHKRHGHYTLGGRVFDFRIKPHFPKSVTKEFLLVDMVNNLDRLAENHQLVLGLIRKRALEFDQKALLRAAQEYGSMRAKKFFGEVLRSEERQNAA